MGVASSFTEKEPSTGSLHHPPNFAKTKRAKQYSGKFFHQQKPVAAPISSYAFGNRNGYDSYGQFNVNRGSSYATPYHVKSPPSYASNAHRNPYSNSFIPPISTDTNSDVKPYDFAMYQNSRGLGTGSQVPAGPPNYSGFINPFLAPGKQNSCTFS